MELVVVSTKFGEHIIYYDEIDAELITKFTWGIRKAKRTFYAWTTLNKEDAIKYGKSSINMHQLLIGAKDGYVIDHKDTNGLNNRRNNLRYANNIQSGANRNVSISSKTGFKGCYYIKKKKLYWSYIRYDGKFISGGQFKNPLKAAKKYNELAVKYFGEFARLNVFTDEQLKELEEYKKPPRGVNKNSKTGYRGVSLSKSGGKKPYFSTIYSEGRNKHLGCYDTAQKAAIAYNEAALNIFGPGAFQNKIIDNGTN